VKNLFPIIACVVAIFSVGFGAWLLGRKSTLENAKEEIVSQITRPFDKYAIETLTTAQIPPGSITTEGDRFIFVFSPSLDPEETKKMTGRITLPSKIGQYPLILMLRGYVDQTIYSSGVGTQKAGDFFTQNGFITIAPDFLGYADSDREAQNIFESRFQTYTTILSLLSSMESIKEWNKRDIFLWGHSNGGQIALTVLEITGKKIPTTLWAPVSKAFPYSILYYTDESEDHGKLIRRELAKFEQDYDVEKFSLTNYLDRINSPLQIHQGTADDAVPHQWTDELSKKLLNLDLNYLVYPGADHNLKPSWDTVVSRDLAFFRKHLQ